MTAPRSRANTRALTAASYVFAILCTLAGTGQTAHARVPRLGVLQIESDEVRDDTFAPIFMQELRIVLDERVDWKAVDTHVSLTQLSLGQDCSTTDPKCLQHIAENLRVDSLLFGKITHDGGAPAVVLRRFDKRTASVRGSALVSLGPTTERSAMRHEVEKLVVTLFGSLDATVVDDDATPVASEQTKPEAEPIVGTDSGGSTVRTVFGYSLLALAAGSLAMSIVSFVEIDQAEHNGNFANYRIAVGQTNATAQDVCSEANGNRDYGLTADALRDVKRVCSTGARFEILQYVFLGAAVLTGGLGAFLLLGNSSGEHTTATALSAPSRFTLQPSFTRKDMSLNATLRF